MAIKALGSKVTPSSSPDWWEIDGKEMTEDQMLDAILTFLERLGRQARRAA
jgi:hypothetical protein